MNSDKFKSWLAQTTARMDADVAEMKARRDGESALEVEFERDFAYSQTMGQHGFVSTYDDDSFNGRLARSSAEMDADVAKMRALQRGASAIEAEQIHRTEFDIRIGEFGFYKKWR